MIYYNETFKDKLINEMNVLLPDKTIILFDNEEGIKSMDFNLYKDFYELPLTAFFEKYVNDNPDNYLNITAQFFIDKYYPNWINIKNALIAQYELMWTGGNERVVSETYKDTILQTSTEDNRLDVMGFNSADYLPSTKNNNTGNNNTDSDRTVERRETNKANSVTYTQAEVIEKELRLRINNKIFDIIKSDIKAELINSVY